MWFGTPQQPAAADSNLESLTPPGRQTIERRHSEAQHRLGTGFLGTAGLRICLRRNSGLGTYDLSPKDQGSPWPTNNAHESRAASQLNLGVEKTHFGGGWTPSKRVARRPQKTQTLTLRSTTAAIEFHRDI